MSEEPFAEPFDEDRTVEQGRRVKSSSLLWFISSRCYVPMADVRRRFGLQTDSGTVLRDEEGFVHIGLPRQAAEALLDLQRKQKVGLEYDLEHAARIVVGVFPLRVRLAPAAPAERAAYPALSPVAALGNPEGSVGEPLPESTGAPAPAGAPRSQPPRGPRRRRRR